MDNPSRSNTKSLNLFKPFKKLHRSSSTYSLTTIPSPAFDPASDTSDISSISSQKSNTNTAHSKQRNLAASHTQPSTTYDNLKSGSVSSGSTIESSRPRHRNLSTFSRHISMTPFNDKNRKASVTSSVNSQFSLRKSSSQISLSSMPTDKIDPNLPKKSFTEMIKEAHKRDMERWMLSQKLNAQTVQEDCMLYSSTRLDTMLDVYDAVLKGEDVQIPELSSKLDFLEFWSISALKFVSGVDVHVTHDVLTQFQNYVKKGKERLRLLRLHNPYYGIQWGWQLAVDNPDCNVFNYSTSPILYTFNANYDSRRLGPSNFHVVHGKTFFDLPFSKNSFSFILAYAMFYTLKDEEWSLLVNEMFRVTQPGGTINLFLMDLDSVNCKNEIYNDYIRKLRMLFDEKGIAHSPCRNIQSKLRDAGYVNVKYSMVSLKRGLPTDLGNTMDLIINYFEFILFAKIASKELEPEDLKEFKKMKLRYNEELRNGRYVEGFGDVYFMLVFGEKAEY